MQTTLLKRRSQLSNDYGVTPVIGTKLQPILQ